MSSKMPLISDQDLLQARLDFHQYIKNATLQYSKSHLKEELLPIVNGELKHHVKTILDSGTFCIQDFFNIVNNLPSNERNISLLNVFNKVRSLIIKTNLFQLQANSLKIKHKELIHWEISFSQSKDLYHDINNLRRLKLLESVINQKNDDFYHLDRPFYNTSGYLQHAAVDNNKVMIEALLKCEFDVDSLDNMQMTALSYAVQCGHKEAINCLIKHGANPNKEDMFGQTLLHLGASKCDIATYETLIANVSDINALGLENATALDYVNECGRYELIATLRAHGAKTSAEFKELDALDDKQMEQDLMDDVSSELGLAKVENQLVFNWPIIQRPIARSQAQNAPQPQTPPPPYQPRSQATFFHSQDQGQEQQQRSVQTHVKHGTTYYS